jgi:hypothetical protein
MIGFLAHPFTIIVVVVFFFDEEKRFSDKMIMASQKTKTNLGSVFWDQTVKLS